MITWLPNETLQLDVVKKPKKMTGTRFAAILGLDPNRTPFQVWTEICRVYDKPFEETKYTRAGKIIEPKQADYIQQKYSLAGLVSPTDMYGVDYMSKTWGDFFPLEEIYGGMWDRINMDNGEVKSVLEFKTTSHPEQWEDGKIPEHYALQVALYAYLLKIDKVVLIPTALPKSAYDDPENFICNEQNTWIVPFKLSERYPNFYNDYIAPTTKWWNDHVVKGISPKYDVFNKNDAEILKYLKQMEQPMEPESPFVTVEKENPFA